MIPFHPGIQLTPINPCTLQYYKRQLNKKKKDWSWKRCSVIILIEYGFGELWPNYKNIHHLLKYRGYDPEKYYDSRKEHISVKIFPNSRGWICLILFSHLNSSENEAYGLVFEEFSNHVSIANIFGRKKTCFMVIWKWKTK